MKRSFQAAWLMVVLVWTASGTVPDASAASGLWRLAQQEQAALEQRGVVLADASLSTYLQSVAERLWKQVPTSLDAPTVNVVMDTQIEAYAYPNGYCFVSTGMLDVLENESQLAMILAHEMVHYSRQHTEALYSHFQQETAHAAGQATDRYTQAVSVEVRHRIDAAERQADNEGLSILKTAGYDEAQVLPMMANLIERMRDRGDVETVGQLEQRAAFFGQRIGLDHKNQPEIIPADSVLDGYRNHIKPALIANTKVALRSGDWEQADRSICKVLASNPQDASAYYLKGEIMRRQNGSDGNNPCIESYEKALEIDPSFPPAHRALGMLHYKAGRYRAAKPYFEAFLALAPQDDAGAYIKGYLRQCPN